MLCWSLSPLLTSSFQGWPLTLDRFPIQQSPAASIAPTNVKDCHFAPSFSPLSSINWRRESSRAGQCLTDSEWLAWVYLPSLAEWHPFCMSQGWSSTQRHCSRWVHPAEAAFDLRAVKSSCSALTHAAWSPLACSCSGGPAAAWCRASCRLDGSCL